MGDDLVLDDDVMDEEKEVSKDVSNTSQLTEKQRKEIRDSLERDIAAFLNGGGQVQKIDDNVRADPPRKPTINYGTAPI